MQSHSGERHLNLEQPAKVFYLLTLAGAERPAQDLKLVQSITCQNVDFATAAKPVSKPTLPAGDQDKNSTEKLVVAGSSERQ